MSQKYADIIIDISHEAVDRAFQYRIPDELLDDIEVGAQVIVPFGKGNTKRNGYVINITETPAYDEDKIKSVASVNDKGLAIEGILIRLADWMHKTYGSTMIQALKTVLPVKKQVRRVEARVKSQEMELSSMPVSVLTVEQQRLVDEFDEDRRNKEANVYLLHGITGSGKTEVYIECIKHCIADGKQAIMLIPEISLASQTVARLRQHFGERVSVLHSELNSGEKYRAIMSIKNHEADVIIGPRSALFAPSDSLGVIIVDEEHDGSYKNEQAPAYHAREAAIQRAALEGVPVILGSATPSLESYTMAVQGAYKLWELNERPDGRKLPYIKLIDMRDELKKGNKSIISKELYEAISECLANNEQIMLFLNRRGLNSCMSCRSCGDTVMCPRCDTSLSLHNNKKLICHICGYSINEPDVCPGCGSPMIGGFGIGIQKIEEELVKLFPNAKILRMDKDTVTAKGARDRVVNAFRQHEADILLGTQMIVKGHDFPEVTLVGVLLADISLFENDFRAGERTYQLLTQAAGRAGRGDKPGVAIIQTYKPDNYAIVAAKKQNYRDFYDMEYTYRRMLKYPPSYNMMLVLVQSEQLECAEEGVKKVYSMLKTHLSQKQGVRLLGPADAAMAKKNGRYRKTIYVKSEDMTVFEPVMRMLTELELSNAGIVIDVNPIEVY